MRCFTDRELRRGLLAVVGDHGVFSATNYLAIFLEAAQPTDGATDDEWPVRHPMHCRSCGRAITDDQGTALVAIRIRERQWTCAPCAAPTG